MLIISVYSVIDSWISVDLIQIDEVCQVVDNITGEYHEQISQPSLVATVITKISIR